MPLPLITTSDLKLALVDTLLDVSRADLKDLAHMATVLPMDEVHDALLKALAYARLHAAA